MNDRNYFENFVAETLKKILDDYNPTMESMGYTKLPLNDVNIKKYKSQNRGLSHIRTGKDYKGFIFVDKENVVGFVNVNTSNNIIQAVEVDKKYQQQGIGKKLLDMAVRELHANELSVNKKNTVAINMYKKYGFKTFKQDDTMLYMKLK